MGINIEAGRMSPYWRPNSVVVTGSGFKRDLYRQVGVPVEDDPLKIHHVGRGETNHDHVNGNGVIVRRREVDVPYPVRVAKAKIEELAPHFPPNGHSHIVTDSTWEIMGPEGHVYSFNKPGGDRLKEAKILSKLYDLRGHRISSDTGAAVLSNDLSETELYHLTLMLGVVNPEIDMGRAEALVTSHPDTSGGFSVIDALQTGIILPDPLVQFRLRKIHPYGAPFETGRIMSFDTAVQELSDDSSNNAWLKRLAVGVIPQK
jgi:hypothetical protein